MVRNKIFMSNRNGRRSADVEDFDIRMHVVPSRLGSF